MVPPLRRVTFSRRRKSNQKGFTLTYGSRCGSGSFAPGSIRGSSPPVCFAAPPLDVFGFAKRSLRSHPGSIPPLSLPTGVEIKSGTRANAHCVEWWRSRAVLELTLIVLRGEKRAVGFGFVLGLPLTPALSPRRGSRFVNLSESEFDSVFQVGVALPNTSASPLSLRERARVRGS
ncbi:hypothetical protein PHLH6_43280 [Pseudomonas sp. Seg1]|nr:hypothetical protein PHLH6_43280 [Pseudomonas sp. Seg1]